MKEEWRQIQGYEGLYEISNLGQAKTHRGCTFKKEIN